MWKKNLSLNYILMPKPLVNTDAFQKLQQFTPPTLKEVLTPERIRSYIISQDPISFSYAASLVNDPILSSLKSRAEEQEVISLFKELQHGEIRNLSENRQVLHHLTRIIDTPSFYMDQYNKIASFTSSVHDKKHLGYTGQPFTDIIQIGIGGSKLGPEALYTALASVCSISHKHLYVKAHFVGNSDPADLLRLLQELSLETTLFIFVSKSGSTPETSSNLRLLETSLKKRDLTLSDFKNHLIAVTCPNTEMDKPSLFHSIFYITDAIGGRFSTSSAVGITLLMLCFGEPIIREFLQGAHQSDCNALEENPLKNTSLLAALISVWDHCILGFPAKAIIPYNSGLSLFPDFLQQLICESNGKQTTFDGSHITHPSAPVVFGESGTNCQHSFFQLLHQGTAITPVQFIGFKSFPFSDSWETITSAKTLSLTSLIAQMTALSIGEPNEDLNKHFYGNRPSSLIIGESFTPKTLGALLAFYENMVIFEGFLMNINSFDQEGVQLGKRLTQTLLDTPSKDPILGSFLSLFS